MLKRILESLKSNPKKLFLIDGWGALLSAFLLGVVLVRLEDIFGIPSSVLYILAVPPVFFAIYDFYCFRKLNNQVGVFLKGIAVMNILYCCLSIGLALYHHPVLTVLGWGYIIAEVMIVFVLAFFELKMARELMRKIGEK